LKQILLIQTAFTGDVVLATPLIEKLKQYYPEAAIDFLLKRGNEGLLVGHPKIREVLILDKKKGKVGELLRLRKAIRRKKYDLVVNMHRFGSSGFLAGFSGARERVGFDKNPFSFRYTKKVTHEIGNGKHETRRNLELIEHLTDMRAEMPKLYPTETDEKMVSFHKSKGPYICIAPTSVWFTKQWPLEKWVELIKLVPASYQVCLLGAPGDRPVCDDIIRRASRENTVNLCGQLTFLQSASLMKDAKMNFVNDSAPLHFASAMNAPVTAIFCSTVPKFGFGPLSEDSVVIEIDVELYCRPCGLHGYKECPEVHFRCAQNIDVKKVAERIP
jgi:lipopolysaccharide heptosyltransferase II